MLSQFLQVVDAFDGVASLHAYLGQLIQDIRLPLFVTLLQRELKETHCILVLVQLQEALHYPEGVLVFLRLIARVL